MICVSCKDIVLESVTIYCEQNLLPTEKKKKKKKKKM
jgi:hypothetical protein